MKILLLVLAFICFQITANANCSTGFACSIDNLKIQDTIYNYFDMNIKEPNFIGESEKIANYRNMFIRPII